MGGYQPPAGEHSSPLHDAYIGYVGRAFLPALFFDKKTKQGDTTGT